MQTEDHILYKNTLKNHFCIKVENLILDATQWCAQLMEISKATGTKKDI